MDLTGSLKFRHFKQRRSLSVAAYDRSTLNRLIDNMQIVSSLNGLILNRFSRSSGLVSKNLHWRFFKFQVQTSWLGEIESVFFGVFEDKPDLIKLSTGLIKPLCCCPQVEHRQVNLPIGNLKLPNVPFVTWTFVLWYVQIVLILFSWIR